MDFSTVNSNFIILVILLVTLIASALCTIMMRNLVKVAITLGLTSAVLTVVMFLLKSPLAAVFELSVCAGLITVVFISTISLTGQKTDKENSDYKVSRMKRFIYLPFMLAAIVIAYIAAWPYLDMEWIIRTASKEISVQKAIWDVRQLDVLGQIIVVFAGVYGIVVLFKERDAK